MPKRRLKNHEAVRKIHPSMRCTVTGKIQYESLEEAQKSAKYVRKNYGPRVHAYKCFHCGKFHIGHGKKRAYKLKLRNKLKT